MPRGPTIEDAQSTDGYSTRHPEEVTRPGERPRRRYDDDRGGRYDDRDPGSNFLSGFSPMNSFRRMMDHMNSFFSDSMSLFEGDGAMDKIFEDARKSPEGTHYVSSTSMCMLPGGVKEMKQRIVANGKEVETHTRAIGDRYISNRREQDIRTGREDVSRNLYDVQEHEVDSFTKDFDQRMSQMPMRSIFDWSNNGSRALFGDGAGRADDRYSSNKALRDRSGDGCGYPCNTNRGADRDYYRSANRDADRMRLSGSRRY